MAKMLINGELCEKPKNGNGQFVRLDSGFRNWVSSDSSSEFPAETGRYHLYISKACPWCHRLTLMLELKGLTDVISVTHMDAKMGAKGWQVDRQFFDKVDGIITDAFVYQVYLRAAPHYSGPISVPILWDKKTNRIVSNDSADIMRMLNSAFDEFSIKQTDYYPKELRADIDLLNDFVYENVNNAVYQVGFAETQQSYDHAVNKLFNALDYLENILEQNRYLAGDQITEADWRLFTTLIRFDAVYVTHFKTDLHRISDYAHLGPYLRELYQIPKVALTVDMNHIRQHYFCSHTHINPFGLVSIGPEFSLDDPHFRDLNVALEAGK